jgi:hypothetical protein
MDKKTTNQVRNILMNELGLTRESIRAEVEKIVRETVEKKLKEMVAFDSIDFIVEQAVSREFDNMARKVPWEKNVVRSLIEDASKDAAEAFVEENIKISCRENDLRNTLLSIRQKLSDIALKSHFNGYNFNADPANVSILEGEVFEAIDKIIGESKAQKSSGQTT